jgi:hypothetical protein
MKFTYSSGQRPLDGYTIKRGIGHGGFGEVYYAVSDGGKEVAIKLVRGNLEVELRGVAQCLNLKHPHLVSLYDMRTDAQGEHWVVMEYIAGEPLHIVLSRHPNGLPPELAQQWFQAMARAIGYLHDHGIVHRDLKPANIFLENGLVKVGDYGLSKFISGSQRNAQTQSVGTVHYMAPEIASGNYNKQIDVYAAGVVLYEMLTGRVPFEGESVAEILMKHLTSPPDLSKVPAEYVNIVGKALAKNPAHRYASMAEMAKAIEGLQADKHARAQPVKVPPVARPVPAAIPIPKAPPPPPQPQPAIVLAHPVYTLRCQLAELSGSLSLAALLAVVFCTLWAAVGGVKDLASIGALFFLTVAVSWTVLIPAKLWNGSAPGDAWGRRVVMMLLGILVGLETMWLYGWTPQIPSMEVGGKGAVVDRPSWSALATSEGLSMAAGYVSYFGLAFCALRWWKMAERRRSNRFSFFPVLAAAFWGLVLLFLWPAQEPTRYYVGAGALVMSAAIVQLVSPWEQPPPPPGKRMRLRCA